MDEAPKHNPWPFIAVDAVLCVAALLIGYFQPQPLSGPAVFSIAGLVFLGAVVAVIPFILNATRRQDRMLDERLREIAALAQNTAAAAEQLSIAAGGLNSIADAANKAVRHAEALPQRMQERIHEFKEQLNEVTVTENEALSQEVNTLRSSETERMESVVTTVRKLSSEFARLEASTRKNVNELTEVLGKFSASAGQASVEAAEAVAAARASAEKSMAAAEAASVSAVQGSLKHAMTTVDAKLAAVSSELSAQIDRASQMFDQKLAALQAASPAMRADRPRQRAVRADQAVAAPDVAREALPAAGGHAAPLEEDVASGSITESELRDRPSSTDDAQSGERVVSVAERAAPKVAVEPETLPESEPNGAEPKASRKRVKREAADNEMTLGLDLPSEDQDADEETVNAAVSADGATRLLVTSYIGIGNKLFVRGEGPGLSWEKGVPLQFVSIGKWRWESVDATAAVKARLFKNDHDECVTLGEIVIEPGHQHEVTAKF